MRRFQNHYHEQSLWSTTLFEINDSSSVLNKDDGSYLPQEYLHLVGK